MVHISFALDDPQSYHRDGLSAELAPGDIDMIMIDGIIRGFDIPFGAISHLIFNGKGSKFSFDLDDEFFMFAFNESKAKDTKAFVLGALCEGFGVVEEGILDLEVD